jgi:hypothetical protein
MDSHRCVVRSDIPSSDDDDSRSVCPTSVFCFLVGHVGTVLLDTDLVTDEKWRGIVIGLNVKTIPPG